MRKTMSKAERQMTNWMEIFAALLQTKDQFPLTYELLHIRKEKTSRALETWAENVNRPRKRRHKWPQAQESS